MAKGQFILPPALTGAPSTANYGNHMCDRRVVYVAVDAVAALLYAVGIPDGEVYEVEPMGRLADDPDCSTAGLSFSCDRARILRRVRFSKADRAAALEALLSP